MKNRKLVMVYSIVLLLLLAVIMLSLSWGSYYISVEDLIKTLFGEGSKYQNNVLFKIRIPRVLVAMVVGLALATAGSILQSITGNELAEPGIIGINSGCAMAVVLLIAYGGGNYYEKISNLTLYLMPVAAIAGGLIAATAIYMLAYKKGISPTRLILTGIGVNAGVNAFITLYQMNMSKGDYNRALTWISGSLWGSSIQFFYLVGPFIIILFGVTLYQGKTLDVMDLADDLATGLGVAVEKSRRRFLFIAVALAALATSVAGNIAFLGLLGPQIAKKMVGPVHIRQIPIAALISMIIILLADAISRNLFSPIELPVGITISIVGVPYFIYLFSKEK